jgi:hypothetical protein
MEKKVCKTCSVEKALDDFWKNKRRIDGKETKCIACIKAKNSTPEKKALQAKLNKEWREKHPEYMAAYMKTEKSKEYHKQYYKENSAIYIQRKQEWVKSNPIQAINARKRYIEQNKDKVNEYHREWKKNKRIEDITYKLKENVSRRIRYELNTHLLKGKNKYTVEYLGCSIEHLKQYLEGRFDIGMNWNNYGQAWHIDHIIPCASWNFEKQFESMCCWNYRNLQPMWALANKSKGDSYNQIKKEAYFEKMKLLLLM